MEILLYAVAIYFVLINIIAFVVRGIDKRKAANDKRRIQEKTLLRLTALWGFIGAFAGMNMFHHKTIKWAFLRWFMLIMFAWIVVLSVFAYFWWAN